MLGKPKFNYGDVVKFYYINEEKEKVYMVGRVSIIDYYGTFNDPSNVSYDITVINGERPGLWKHNNEKFVKKATKKEIAEFRYYELKELIEKLDEKSTVSIKNDMSGVYDFPVTFSFMQILKEQLDKYKHAAGIDDSNPEDIEENFYFA